MKNTQRLIIAYFFVFNIACKFESQQVETINTTENASQIPNEQSDQNENIIEKNNNVTLQSDMNLRTLKSGILEPLIILKQGTQISIPESAQTVNYQYRNDQGQLVFSSTGFYPKVRIVSGPYSQTEINSLNRTSTGLFIGATVSAGAITGPSYPAVKLGTANSDYLSFFNANGKPKRSYTSSLNTRFPNSANKAISMSTLPGAEQTKWNRIMRQLQILGDRTKPALKSDFVLDKDQAMQFAIDFEKNGTVQKIGAWSIAVQGTATRNGFANVPCAEFMSEILRQAYAKAGYSHYEDFNENRKNVLSYFYGAAAVVNFSAYLEKAGWIPWDPQIYIPPTGAFMMHAQGKSPGHTYMIAGQQGRLIMDNGMPQGRDLGQTSLNTIEMMYQHGVFFLPPGFTPKKW